MADITDGLGRVSSGNADFESLKKGLESVVKKTMDFVSKNSERAASDYGKLAEALGKLDSSIGDSIKASKEFVEKVGNVAKEITQKKETPQKGADEKMEDLAKKQLKVLKAMLKAHMSASNSANVAGPTGVARKAKIGVHGPRGKDTVASYLQPGEAVIPKKDVQTINKNRGAFVSPYKPLGFSRGGIVKPRYMAGGSGGGGATGPISMPGRLLDLLGGLPKGTSDAVVEVHLDGSALGPEAKKEAQEVERIMESRLRNIGGYMTSISTQLMGGHKFTEVLFSGVVEDATKLRREMREIAFQTQGVTGNMRGLQAAFADIGKNVVAETGQSVTALKDALIKNTRKGLGKGGMDGMKSTLKSGLYLSTMIGSEAQQTADLFGDWSRQLKLSSSQMETMARDMRGIALSTGVTGDELLEAMKASQGILKNMRNSGNLTTDGMRNVVTMMAEARKTGDEEMTSELLNNMSSFKSMMGASNENKALLYGIAARMDGSSGNNKASTEMMHGRFANSRENLRGMETEIINMLGSYSNGAIKSLSDIDKLSASERDSMNVILSGMGTSLEQMRQLAHQSGLAGRGLAGQLEEQEKILNKRYATEEEKMLAQQRMNEAYSNNALNYLSAIRDKSSDMPLPEIFSEMANSDKFSSLREDFVAMAGALDSGMKSKFGISGTAEQQKAQMAALSGQQKMQLTAAVAADQLMKAAKAQGKEVKDFSAMAANVTDNDSFNKFNEEIQSEFKKMGVDQATKVDPMTELNQTMLKLNETIRGYTSPLIGGFIDFIGATGLLLVQLGLLTGAMYAFYGKGLLTLIRTLRGGGGGKSKIVSGVSEVWKGVSKGTKAFSRGFSKARAAGDTFFASLGKGFVRAMKANRLTRGAPAAMSRWYATGTKGVSMFGSAFQKGFTRSMKKGIPLIGSFGKGFSYAMKSTDATRGVLHGFSNALTGLNGKYIQTLASIKKVSPALSNFIRHSVNLGKSFTMLKFGEIIPRFAAAMRSGFQVFKNAFNPASWKALPRIISMGFKGARASIVAGSLGTAQIIFSAIDMVFGAVTGFMNTGKNFEGVMKAMGKTTADMTWGMYVSSTLAGGLVGILDGLTFGLLSMTGAAEWLNKALSMVIYLTWSFYEGIVNGVVAAFQMVWSAIKYIGKQFEGMGNSLLEIFNSIAGIFGAKAGNWSEAFAMIYPWLKRIGTIIGFIVGGPLVGFLWLLVKGISLVLVPIQMLLAAFAAVFKVIGAFVQFFKDIFTVGLWQATKNLGSTVLQAVYGIFKPVVDFVWSLGQDIIAPFKWLYNILVGNSIIPDLCTAVVNFFANMASNALKFVGNMVSGTVKFFAGLPGKAGRWLHRTFVKGPTNMFNRMFKLLNTKTLRTGLGVMSEKFSNFFGLFKSNLNGLTKFFTGSWYTFLNTATGGLFGKIVDSIKNSKMYQIVDDFLIKPISSGLQWLGSRAGEIFKGTMDWIRNAASRWIPGFGKGASAAGAADDAAKAAAKAAEPFAKMGGAMGKQASKTAQVADEAAKAAAEASKANPFAKMGGDMGKQVSKSATSLSDDLVKAAGETVAKGGAKTVSAAASGVDDLAKSAPAALGFLGKSSKLVTGIARKLPVVGPLIDFGARTLIGKQSVGKAATGTAAGAGGGLAGAAAGAAIGTMILPGPGTAIGGLLGGLIGGVGAGMASDAIYDKVVGTGSGAAVKNATKDIGASDSLEKSLGTSEAELVRLQKAAEAAGNGLQVRSAGVATPVGEHAVPAARVDDVSGVQPVHLRDISQTMLRDRTSTQAGNRQLRSDELTRIQEASDQQVFELQQIREGINSLVEYMRPSGSVLGGSEPTSGSTKDPRRPDHAAVFGRRKYGDPGGQAARALVNDGEV